MLFLTETGTTPKIQKKKMRRQDVVLAPARDQKARAFREARRTGFLSFPAKNLTEFPPQVYHLDEHMEKDEKKWECVDLVKMDLRYCHLMK